MKMWFQQKKRFYFSAMYVVLTISLIFEEIFTFRLNENLARPSDFFFSVLEVLLGICSIVGVILIFREIRENNQNINSAKEAIDSLKIQNKRLADMNKSFWNSVLSQFRDWGLSEAEKEIAALLLRGLSNQQIAAIRGKSLKTIENQTFSIYQKSGTTGKLEFIAYFLNPLLPEED